MLASALDFCRPHAALCVFVLIYMHYIFTKKAGSTLSSLCSSVAHALLEWRLLAARSGHCWKLANAWPPAAWSCSSMYLQAGQRPRRAGRDLYLADKKAARRAGQQTSPLQAAAPPCQRALARPPHLSSAMQSWKPGRS